MKAKKIHEAESFERGLDPKESLAVGSHSPEGHKILYDKLEDKGVQFWLHFMDYTEEERKEYFIENIHKINEFVEKVINVGVDPKGIRVSAIDRIGIPMWEIKNSNRVIANCVTKEDANFVVNTMNAFAMEDHNKYYTEINTSSLSDSITNRDNMNNILDNLEANRKKYRKL